MKANEGSRRRFLQGAGSLAMLAAAERLVPAYAQTGGTNAAAQGIAAQAPRAGDGAIELVIDETPFRVDGRKATAVTINGTVPGPLIRLREGEDVTIRVTNRLRETSSIHWHGLILPPEMDGVPGVSFAGIKAGTTFTYRFPVRQYGTYWCHSHSGGQEQLGVYAPMIIDPAEPDPIKYDREYVVMLSDWSFTPPETLIANMKKQSGNYNFQQRTMIEFVRDVRKNGWKPTVDNYLMWSKMRMEPTDFADVTGETYTYLTNGLSPDANWTGLFNLGERVRLRFINGASMTIFDARIPGLKMTVVQADGQNVQPVEVDEFRISPAETYDVIVEPTDERAYTIFAESIDRSGYARGTLAPRPGMSGEIPTRRPRPLRSMEDMGMSMEGMDGMGGMNMSGGNMSGMNMGAGNKSNGGDMKGMDMNMPGMKMGGDAPKSGQASGGNQSMDMQNMPGMQNKQQMPGMPNMQRHQGMANMPGMFAAQRAEIPGSTPVKHSPDKHGIGNQMSPDQTRARLDDPGAGLGNDNRRVLVYTDLKALHPYPDQRQPERELEIHITGHMERSIWSFDGKKYSEAKTPIHFRTGERLRWTFVNDTMMEHPLHLHGMWMHLENGTGAYLPRKHTVLVKPAERVSVAITADAPGRWAFHCHMLLHMEQGMFRVVEVSDKQPEVRS